MLFAPKLSRSSAAADEVYLLNDVIDLPVQKTNLVADLPVVDQPGDGQPATEDASPISEQDFLNTTPPEETTSPGFNNLSSAQDVKHQHLMLNHLDIDSDEFKTAVHVPRLEMDRMLDSAMLHSKLNDLLERGLIPHDAARAAFRLAQQNRIDR